MNILQAIILGFIQGLTEFIPVSSSGHLVIAHEWLGINQTAQAGFLFDMALNIGTVLALLIYFRKDIIVLFKAIFNKKAKEFTLAWLLALATLPAAVAGFLLKDMAESTFRSTRLVACALIVAGLIMLAAEWYSQRLAQKTQLEKVSIKQSLAIGCAQALALIPGVSRSGATITTGLFVGMERVAATRFSFLLGIPIMLGAIASTLVQGSALDTIGNDKAIFIAGIISAFVSGVFAIQFLLKFLAKHSLSIFGYYRIVLGVVILALAVLR